MKYNIGFTLGDLGGDGHACTTDYHIVANHSAEEDIFKLESKIKYLTYILNKVKNYG